MFRRLTESTPPTLLDLSPQLSGASQPLSPSGPTPVSFKSPGAVPATSIAEALQTYDGCSDLVFLWRSCACCKMPNPIKEGGDSRKNLTDASQGTAQDPAHRVN
eukprot:gene10698-biopygen6526